MPGDRLAQRVGRARALRVAEVEAVRDRRRLGAAAGDVERRLRDRLGAAAARVERDARAVAVERHGDRALRRRQPHDAGVAARAGDRARADDLVVLLVDPRLGADVGRGQQPQQQVARVAGRRHVLGRERLLGERLGALRPRAGSAAASASASAGMSPTTSPSQRQRRRPSSVTSPIAVHGSCQRAQTASTSSRRAGSTIAHMRSCDSEIMISNGCMPCSRSGTRSSSSSMPTPPLAAISEVDEARPGGAQVLHARRRARARPARACTRSASCP